VHRIDHAPKDQLNLSIRTHNETLSVAAATDSRTSASSCFLLNMNFGNMTHAEAMLSLRLFGTEVLPAFR